jgi:alpha/beta superfamily hydrolase
MPDNQNTTLVTIPEAGHFFTNYKTEDLADAIQEFVLKKANKSAAKNKE